MKRVSVAKLKKQFGTNGFFLTTYFATQPHCVAIKREYVGKKMLHRLYKHYGIVETKEYIYIFEELY